MTEELKVGSKIWCHDYRSNSRRWFDDDITDETRVSWIVGASAYKVNKKTMLENQGAYGNRQWHTEASKDVYIWLQQHPRQIAKLVEGNKDIATLLRVATLVGYVVEAPALSSTLRESGQ